MEREADRSLTQLVDELASARTLSLDGYEALIAGWTPELARYAAARADEVRRRVYGDRVFIRGLIEISNYCKNDCRYCGIRRSNAACTRYRLTPDQVLACTDEGYDLGFRTFVLQGGEDPHLTDERLCALIRRIKGAHPDCAVTLSLGERSRESYQALFDAGADRYLLRHETATEEHYRQLHPPEMSFARRMECLRELREIGYVVGAGFIVGSPYQTPAHLAADLKFIERFAPEMCGIGPFVPHHATEFAQLARGSVDLTCFLLSLLRLANPALLLPATTALGTLEENGREKGLRAGANVVMPNLSPRDVRAKYEIYDNKLGVGEEAAEGVGNLAERVSAIGYRIVVDRGDPAQAI